jgi:hypothetical protein
MNGGAHHLSMEPLGALWEAEGSKYQDEHEKA